MDDVCVLGSSSRSITRLMTLEALWINHLKPSINTKDEYRIIIIIIYYYKLYLGTVESSVKNFTIVNIYKFTVKLFTKKRRR